jgi:hypothetical protein
VAGEVSGGSAREQKVFCANGAVVEKPRVLLSQDEDASGSAGKAFEHEARVVGASDE